MAEVKNVFSNKVERGSAWERSQQSLDQLAARARAQLNRGQFSLVRPRLIRHSRDPMWVTTTAWNRNGDGIALYANPTDMSWALPRRGTVVKTTAGAVRNVWRNRYRGTYYNEGTVTIKFQTGNIMPFMGYPSELDLMTSDQVSYAVGDPRVPEGLDNFYRFMSLLDQPMLLGAAENRHIIVHHSRVFPDLYMEGYFTEDSFDFSEASTDGNRLEWSATFQIYRTSPKLFKYHDLVSKYERWVGAHAQDEQIGSRNLDKYLYPGGLSDVPGTPPAGDPKQGPTVAKKPTTVATMSGKKAQALADQAYKRLPANQRTLEGFFGI